MFVSIFIGTVSIVIIVGYIINTKRRYSFFQIRHLKNPAPRFFFGNLSDIYTTEGRSNRIKQWSENYQSNFGYFEGRTPVFVVGDMNVLTEISTTHNKCFYSRRPLPLEDRRPSVPSHVFSATDKEWDRQRKVIVQQFHQLKKHCMYPSIDESVTNMLEKLNTMNDECMEGFDIYEIFKSLTIEVIWKCCFGVRINMQINSTNEYFVKSQQVFDREFGIYFMGLMSVYFPRYQPYFLIAHYAINNVKRRLRRILPFGTRFIDEDPSEWLKDHIKQLIKEITENPNERCPLAENNPNENTRGLLHLLQDVAKSSGVLSPEEVTQNIFMFMLAGYESTSTALVYATHLLAIYPEEQQKVKECIDENAQPDTPLNAHILKEMTYLDWFIKETLRMYPVAPVLINRQCSQDVDVKGLSQVEKGSIVTLDMHRVHNDPNIWGPVDPHTFYPKRFESLGTPTAWMPFGFGHRICLGKEFALTEIKIALIRLLQKYEICRAPDTLDVLETEELVTIKPKKVPVRLIRRNNQN